MMQINVELIISIIAGFGAIVLGLQKAGLIHFGLGRPAERRDCAKKCSEHEKMVTEAVRAADEAKELQDDIKRIEERLDRISQRLDELSQTLHEVIGWMKGRHHMDGGKL